MPHHASVLTLAQPLEPASGSRVDSVQALELAEQAICHRDDAAWQTLVERYRWLVLAWVRQHPSAWCVHEDDAFWVDRTFQRLWMALRSGRLDQFSSSKALLGYLKLCAASVVMDEARLRHHGRFSSLDDLPEAVAHTDDSADAVVVDRMAARDLWDRVEAQLHTEQERLVARLSWIRGWRPAQIATRYPSLFADVADVYRVKRNLIDRLRNELRHAA